MNNALDFIEMNKEEEEEGEWEGTFCTEKKKMSLKRWYLSASPFKKSAQLNRVARLKKAKHGIKLFQKWNFGLFHLRNCQKEDNFGDKQFLQNEPSNLFNNWKIITAWHKKAKCYSKQI